DEQGFVRVADLEAAIQGNTVLVSVIHGHNEVGSLQPIGELARVCRQRGIPFHTDAVQSVAKVPLEVEALGVDLLSVSGHKFGAPQGIGALLVRPGLALAPWLRGGGQEQGLRSGTQAVGLIAALGEACRLAQEELPLQPYGTWQRQLALALQAFPQLQLTGSRDFSRRLPQHLSYVVEGWASGELVRRLAAAGIGISGGSACWRGKPQPNRILQAMGYSAARALTGIRISWGWGTTWEDLARLPEALREIL
ncbi:MAG: aminotransferase class V-fold PLP-dependent enzyme, partial [Thermostichales cyanobacterium BF4_bins_65]